jgi:hypothetical protein
MLDGKSSVSPMENALSPTTGSTKEEPPRDVE